MMYDMPGSSDPDRATVTVLSVAVSSDQVTLLLASLPASVVTLMSAGQLLMTGSSSSVYRMKIAHQSPSVQSIYGQFTVMKCHQKVLPLPPIIKHQKLLNRATMKMKSTMDTYSTNGYYIIIKILGLVIFYIR